MNVSGLKALFRDISFGSLEDICHFDLGIEFVRDSIGEPAAVFDFKNSDFMLAFTNDGVGIKNIIADTLNEIFDMEEKYKERMWKLYNGFGKDLIAMNANDLLCVGAIPIALLLDLGLGNETPDKRKFEEFTRGLSFGLHDAKMWLSGGETAILKDAVSQNSINISGAAIGVIKPKTRLMLGEKIREGDIIIGLESSGIHSNGLTKAREIIAKFPKEDLLKIKLSDGELLYKELLRPTRIYVEKIRKILDYEQADVHYISHITGAGWRKIMRAKQDFTYIIEELPPLPPIFEFLQKEGGVSDKEAFGTWNMDIGMAIIAPADHFHLIKNICESSGNLSDFEKIRTYFLGRVEKGQKQVYIKPKNIILR